MDEDQELKELRDRAAAVRAEREALEAERARKAEVETARAELAAEEQRLKDEPEIAKAVNEHGAIGSKIAVVETDMGAIVVKRPPPVVFKRFQDKGSTKTDDFWSLVKPCIVYPDVRRVNEILEALPGTLGSLADEVVTLAGYRTKEAGGK